MSKTFWSVKAIWESEESEMQEMPQLTGTEKQVAWGADIRCRQYADVSKKLGDYMKLAYQMGEGFEVLTHVQNAIADFFATHTSAKSWIEIENNLWQSLTAEYEPELDAIENQYRAYRESNRDAAEEFKKNPVAKNMIMKNIENEIDKISNTEKRKVFLEALKNAKISAGWGEFMTVAEITAAGGFLTAYFYIPGNSVPQNMNIAVHDAQEENEMELTEFSEQATEWEKKNGAVEINGRHYVFTEKPYVFFNPDLGEEPECPFDDAGEDWVQVRAVCTNDKPYRNTDFGVDVYPVYFIGWEITRPGNKNVDELCDWESPVTLEKTNIITIPSSQGGWMLAKKDFLGSEE